jgi:hypothetical protein
MTTAEILALTIIVLVVLVWRITWLATRARRASTRAGRNPGRELLQSAKLPTVIVQTVRN